MPNNTPIPQNSSHPHLLPSFFFSPNNLNDVLQKMELPDNNDWFEPFAVLIQPFCEGFDAKTKINEHIGYKSLFTARDLLARMIYVMYQWSKDPEMQSQWAVYAPKIAEGIEQCTLGLNERCTQIFYACYKPKNLHQLLARMRYSLIEGYIQTHPYVSGTHDADLVPLAAQIEGYGISAASTTSVQRSQQETMTRITKDVITLFDTCYQLPYIVTELVARIELEMRSEQSYVGRLPADDSVGYVVGLTQALEKALRITLSLPQIDYDLAKEAQRIESTTEWMDCYIFADLENDDYKILDIDWLAIHSKLWTFLFNNQLITQFDSQQNITEFLNGINENPTRDAQQAFIECLMNRSYAHDWLLYAYKTLPWFPKAYVAGSKIQALRVDGLISRCLHHQSEQFLQIMADQELSVDEILASSMAHLRCCIEGKNYQGFVAYIDWGVSNGLVIDTEWLSTIIIQEGTLVMLEKLYQIAPADALNNSFLLVKAIYYRSLPFAKFLIETKQVSPDVRIVESENSQRTESILEYCLRQWPPDEAMAEYLLTQGAIPVQGLALALTDAVSNSMLIKILGYMKKEAPFLSIILLESIDFCLTRTHLSRHKIIALRDCLFIARVLQNDNDNDLDPAYYCGMKMDNVIKLFIPGDQSLHLDQFYKVITQHIAHRNLPQTNSNGRRVGIMQLPDLLPILAAKASGCFTIIYNQCLFNDIDSLYDYVLTPLRQLPYATQQFWMDSLLTIHFIKQIENLSKLHMACFLGLTSVVKQILVASKNPKQEIARVTRHKLTSFHLAVQSEQMDLIEYLLALGADIKQRPKGGRKSILFDIENDLLVARLWEHLDVAQEVDDIVSYQPVQHPLRAQLLLTIITTQNSLIKDGHGILPLIVGSVMEWENSQPNAYYLLLSQVVEEVTQLCKLQNDPLKNQFIQSLLYDVVYELPLIVAIHERVSKECWDDLIRFVKTFAVEREQMMILLQLPKVLTKSEKVVFCVELLNHYINVEENAPPSAKRTKLNEHHLFSTRGRQLTLSSVAKKMQDRIGDLKNTSEFSDNERQVIRSHQHLLIIHNELCQSVRHYGSTTLEPLSSTSSSLNQ